MVSNYITGLLYGNNRGYTILNVSWTSLETRWDIQKQLGTWRRLLSIPSSVFFDLTFSRSAGLQLPSMSARRFRGTLAGEKWKF